MVYHNLSMSLNHHVPIFNCTVTWRGGLSLLFRHLSNCKLTVLIATWVAFAHHTNTHTHTHTHTNKHTHKHTDTHTCKHTHTQTHRHTHTHRHTDTQTGRQPGIFRPERSQYIQSMKWLNVKILLTYQITRKSDKNCGRDSAREFPANMAAMTSSIILLS